MSFLTELLSCRTAPFREHFAEERLKIELDHHRIPSFKDPHGNVVVGAGSSAEYLRILKRGSASAPTRFFIAHMDHPGFHIAGSGSGLRLEATWHGGTPVEHLESAEVWLKCRDLPNWEGRGRIRSAMKAVHGRSVANSQIEISEPLPSSVNALSLFGGFRFQAPCWEEAGCVRGSVCDDLVGCFAIIETAKKVFTKGKARAGFAPFLGLLSRAEEVGFVGTIAHLELGWIKKSRIPPLVVSLETSRALLPGAEIGKGPVVRLGDKFTVFSPGPTRALTELAAKILPEKHQRRIMDGGTCEGSAATVFGLPTIALSVPLGNYHNQSFEGGTGSLGSLGPAPEFVHLQDVAGLLALTSAIAKRAFRFDRPWEATRTVYRQSLVKYRALLAPGASRPKKPQK